MKNFLTRRSAVVTGFVATVFSSSVLALTPPTYVDMNGDGVISVSEVTEIRDRHRAAMLNEYDANGDGELSRMERRKVKDARYGQLVLQFDADGNGELSREERRMARDQRRAVLEAQFDVNQDGTLSDQERAGLDFVEKQRGRGGRKDRRAGHKHKGKRHNNDAAVESTE